MMAATGFYGTCTAGLHQTHMCSEPSSIAALLCSKHHPCVTGTLMRSSPPTSTSRRGKHARKRLAVPFRAAHTPAERSEFAQPDLALLLTHLAYYEDGLSAAELEAAVRELLKAGRNEQRARFAVWVELMRPLIPPGSWGWQQLTEVLGVLGCWPRSVPQQWLSTQSTAEASWTQAAARPGPPSFYPAMDDAAPLTGAVTIATFVSCRGVHAH